MTNIKSNIWKLYAGTFLHEILFIAAIIVPFLGHLGLSMQEILITESIFSVTILILEVPSGYFADRVGRKPSLILGAIGWIVGVSLYTFTGSFLFISIGAIFWGIGASFISGANEAMLYESLHQLKRENEYKKIQGNLFFWGRIASIIGSIAAGFMASYSTKLPAYATLVAVILALFVYSTLVETKHEIQEKESWKHFKIILRESFLQNKVLRYFILFTSIGGFFSIEFWLAQRYWEFLSVPILYFGFLVAAMNIFSALMAKYAQEIEKKIGAKLSLILLTPIPILIWLIFANIGSIWVIPLFFLNTGLRGFMVPVFNDFIQKHSSHDRRATIMSVKSLLNRMIFVVFAPFLGWVADIYTIQTAFLWMAGIIFVFGIGTMLFLKKVKIL